VPFDTRDRRLRRLGIRLECRLRRRASRWTLVLPRGEVVKTRGSARPDAPPPLEITKLLRGIVGAEPLVPVRWHSDHLDFARLEAFVLEQRDAMLRHEPGARLGLDSENLHQFRVADRRLRAALRAGRRLVDRTWADSLRRQLAELGAVTGPVRDLDVVLERLGHELGDVQPADRPALGALLDALRAERETRQDDLRRTLDGPDYRRLLDALEAPPTAADRRPTRGLRELASRELYRLVEEVRELGRSPSDHELHRLRITVKRVRYAVELAGAPTKRHRARVIDAARSIQDLLGAYQDTVVTENHLRRVSQATGDGSIGFVAGLLAERERRLRRRLNRQLPPAWKQLRRATRAIRT
jgi:CHAD domain-containing protein